MWPISFVSLVLLSLSPATFAASSSDDCFSQTGLDQSKVALHSAISFAVTLNGAPVTALCPGQTYTVTASFPYSAPHIFAVSQGTLARSDTGCPGRISTDSSATSVTTTLTLPSTATGTVQMRATIASDTLSAHHQNTATFTIDPTCRAAAFDEVLLADLASTNSYVSRSLAQATTAPAPATGTPAQMATMQQFITTAHSFPQCTVGKLQYNYSCNREDTPGWQMSYTLSTSPVPPDNPCTRGTLASAANNALPAGANGWAHILIAHAVTGYTSIAFTRVRGAMNPGNAVLGGIYDSLGTGYVASYTLEALELPPPDNPATSWAYNLGTYQQTTPDRRTVICFSRGVLIPGPPAPVPAPSAGKRRDLLQTQGRGPGYAPPDLSAAAGIEFSLAAHEADGFAQHTWIAGGNMNFQTGEVQVSIDNEHKKMVDAHAGIMIAVFMWLMPLAIVSALHKRIIPEVMLKGKALWFWIHAVMQLLSIVCFFAGIAIAWSKFKGSGMEEVKGARDAHSALGIILTVLISLQLFGNIIRPAPTHNMRPWWNLLHHVFGRATLVIGMVTVSIGIYLYSHLFGGKLWQSLAWATIAGASTAFAAYFILAIFDARAQSTAGAQTQQAPHIALSAATNGTNQVKSAPGGSDSPGTDTTPIKANEKRTSLQPGPVAEGHVGSSNRVHSQV